MSEASQRAGAQQRLARAREALLRAEQRAGVRGTGHGELRRAAARGFRLLARGCLARCLAGAGA